MRGHSASTTDLAPLGEAMCTILAVGQDEDLLHTRSAVLRKCNAGATTARASEAIEILKAERFDLVVLCHTLSTEDRNTLVLLAHQQPSDIRVLEILNPTKQSWDRIIVWCRRYGTLKAGDSGRESYRNVVYASSHTLKA